ncbi:hypothetical protein, partial [Pseudomonas lundensis]|uniref:hypothetical protein n=2 Tax=Pseudomonas lundensis TaxID=86185 RepID=UPI001475C9F6
MNMLERKLAARNARKAFLKRRAELRRVNELAKPTVQGVLPGEPQGLMPKALLKEPLKVGIPHWAGLPEDPNFPVGDELTLQWRLQNSDDNDTSYTDLLKTEIKGAHPDPIPLGMLRSTCRVSAASRKFTRQTALFAENRIRQRVLRAFSPDFL